MARVDGGRRLQRRIKMERVHHGWAHGRVRPLDIRAGDTVVVIAGKDRGKRGVVERTVPEEHRIVVRGVNILKRHTRAGVKGNVQGGIVDGQTRTSPCPSRSASSRERITRAVAVTCPAEAALPLIMRGSGCSGGGAPKNLPSIGSSSAPGGGAVPNAGGGVIACCSRRSRRRPCTSSFRSPRPPRSESWSSSYVRKNTSDGSPRRPAATSRRPASSAGTRSTESPVWSIQKLWSSWIGRYC